MVDPNMNHQIVLYLVTILLDGLARAVTFHGNYKQLKILFITILFSLYLVANVTFLVIEAFQPMLNFMIFMY